MDVCTIIYRRKIMHGYIILPYFVITYRIPHFYTHIIAGKVFFYKTMKLYNCIIRSEIIKNNVSINNCL